MANLYSALAEATVPTGVDSWGMFFLLFGVTKNAGISDCTEYGTCYISSHTVNANYYFPVFSNLFLMVIGIGLLVGGTIYLKRRDIS